MTRFLLVTLLSASFLTSCASIEKEWINKNCNTNAAYNSGLTHGLTPNNVPVNDYASHCPVNNDTINSAYLRGFTEGVKTRPQEININKNVNVE